MIKENQPLITLIFTNFFKSFFYLCKFVQFVAKDFAFISQILIS